MSSLPFVLDRSLDAEAAARTYRATGRVQIEPFLAPECAEALAEHLRGREDWRLNLNAEGSRVFNLDRRTLAAWSSAQMKALRKSADPTEIGSFRYLYDNIIVVDDHNRLQEQGTLLADFGLFLSSEAVIALFRAITGATDIAFADAFASRYGSGDFLTMHHDKKEGSTRIAAYAYSLTEEWRPEWGGLLLFHDKAGDVESGLSPRWNALNLFSVPQDHSVSQVATFAPVPRLSVTGWLRPLPTEG